MLCNINNDNCNIYYEKSMIVMYGHNYFSFNILLHRIKWNILRIIWIGFYENMNNNKCYIDLLSKDVILHIIKFIGIPSKISNNDHILKNNNNILALEI